MESQSIFQAETRAKKFLLNHLPACSGHLKLYIVLRCLVPGTKDEMVTIVTMQIYTQRPVGTDDVGRHIGLQDVDCVEKRTKLVSFCDRRACLM